MVHCVLCEDEPSHRKQLRQLLEQELQSRNLVYEIAEYDSGEWLLNDLEHGRQQVDILFMDIFLGAVDGIQAARRIRETDPFVQIVYVTQSDKFALEGYDVCAVGYLIKPIQPLRFREVMDRAVEQVLEQEHAYIALLHHGKLQKLPLRRILFVESRKNNLVIHTQDGDIVAKGKLDDFEHSLPEEGFIRIHKSYLVNIAFIGQHVKNEVKLVNGQCLPISRSHAEEVRAILMDYLLRHGVRIYGKLDPV
jgi:DNA-binding LytR/AlgR family response regulator